MDQVRWQDQGLAATGHPDIWRGLVQPPSQAQPWELDITWDEVHRAQPHQPRQNRIPYLPPTPPLMAADWYGVIKLSALQYA